MNVTLKSLIQDSYSKVSMDHIAYEQPYMSGAYINTSASISGDLARGGSFWLSLNNQSNAEVQAAQDPLMGGISVLLAPHGNARRGMTIINPRSVDGMFGGATGKQRAIGQPNTFVECMTVPKETPTINALSTAPGSAPSTSTLVSPAQQGRAEVGNIDNLSGGSTFNGSQPITILGGNILKDQFKWKGSIGGFDPNPNDGVHVPNSQHYRGLALDFGLSAYGSVDGSGPAHDQGLALFNYAVAHAKELHIHQVIFEHQDYIDGNIIPYRKTDHFNHVHIGFQDVAVPDFNSKYRIKNGKLESLVNTAAPKQNNATDAAKSAAFTTPKADVHFGGNGQSVFTGTDLLTPKSAFDMNWTPL